MNFIYLFYIFIEVFKKVVNVFISLFQLLMQTAKAEDLFKTKMLVVDICSG